MRAQNFSTMHDDSRRATKHRGRFLVKLFALLLFIVIAAGAYFFYQHYREKPVVGVTSNAASLNHGNCEGMEDKVIIVSISTRHLWACNGSNTVYETPVVTGMQNLAADLTPLGTYHIYAKQTNQTLTGSDSTGNWNDHVYYWEPFLNNQYGTYGFHDATWRKDTEFGNIDPYSMNGSHGCVELPLNAAKWIYDWSAVGTTVSIVA